jgi:hypothetical protein
MSESVRQAAVAEIDSHRRLLRSGRYGRILSALMFLLLRWAPPAGYGVLTTMAPKTGKPRRRCALHRRGLPSRTKTKQLHRYWFETGIPVAIDLKELDS